MEKELKQKTTDNFNFYYPPSLEPLVVEFQKYYNKKWIFEFFNITNFKNITVNLFDNRNKFVEFITKNEKQPMIIPDYCKGVFGYGMISIYIQNLTEKKFGSYICSIYHEYIHILNKELFYDKRVVWFDEGLAESLCGKIGRYYEITDYIDIIKYFIEQNEHLPKNFKMDLNNFNFDNNNDDSDYINKNRFYNWSLIAVLYLINTLSHEEFLKIAKNSQEQILLGKTVLINAINFFKNFN